MKTIRQFLGKAGARKPKEGQRGQVSEWLPFHRLTLVGSALQLVERRVLGLRGNENPECVEIPVAPGVFEVRCKGIRYGNDARIAGLRAYPEGTEVKRAKKLGEIPVDLAAISVVDIEPLEPSVDEDEERYEDWIDEVLYESDSDSSIGCDVWEPLQMDLPFVVSGFGDGVYDVWALKAKRKVVGMEIVFIEDDAPYPIS
jgi:hypothetical protein